MNDVAKKWKEYPPLQAALQKKDSLQREVSAIEAKLEGLRDHRVDQAEIDRLETQVMIGKGSEADLQRLVKQKADTEAQAAQIMGSMSEPKRRLALLIAGIPTLEAEAQKIAQAEWHRKYKPAVKKLLKALEAAHEANAEVDSIFSAAGEEFPRGAGESFMDSFACRFLNMTPDPIWGDKALAGHMKKMRAYLES